MSVTDQNGWGEVERRAREHEGLKAMPYADYSNALNHMLNVSVEDRLRGAIIEAIRELEHDHRTSAQQILEDSLKIKSL